ncbi:hypothetical protein [Streptomyces kronopolitis]|uniref:hypothetical protein n=1 Tax=Streptomyces kronopolitis TaxID=1612435 RepID=UPI00368742BB
MRHPHPLPPPGHAEVRIVAATPEAARLIAEALRRRFAATEQRSYPAGGEGGTRLHLTVDTTHTAAPPRPWPATGEASGARRLQADEI